MRSSLAVKLLVFAIVWLAAGQAAASEPGGGLPIVGTWVGAEVGFERELTVLHVDQDGVGYGWYCTHEPGVYRVTDFHSGRTLHGAVEAWATARTLRTTVGEWVILAAVNPDGTIARVTASSAHHAARKRYSLVRTDAAAAPCHPRIAPFVVDALPGDERLQEQTFADLVIDTVAVAGAHPLIGSWTGQRENGLTVELNIVAVADDGTVTGLYCNLWRAGWRATDMDYGIPGAIRATATESQVAFGHKDTGRTYTFTLEDQDTMTYVRAQPDKGAKTLAMVRTKKPTCASRIIVRGGLSDESGRRPFGR